MTEIVIELSILVGAALVARSIDIVGESIRAEFSSHHREQREMAVRERNDRQQAELNAARGEDYAKWSKDFSV